MNGKKEIGYCEDCRHFESVTMIKGSCDMGVSIDGQFPGRYYGCGFWKEKPKKNTKCDGCNDGTYTPLYRPCEGIKTLVSEYCPKCGMKL